MSDKYIYIFLTDTDNVGNKKNSHIKLGPGLFVVLTYKTGCLTTCFRDQQHRERLGGLSDVFGEYLSVFSADQPAWGHLYCHPKRRLRN